MGLITGLLTSPLAPLRGTIACAAHIHRQAEKAFYDPGAIRRQLEQVDALRETGELSDDRATAIEEALIDRLVAGQSRPDLWED